MSKKLFVGGLAWETDDATLADVFNEYGEVLEARVITDRDTGRSRGFGFVTFESEAAAANAQKAMNGRQLDGRALRVDMATEQAPRTGGGGGGGGGSGRGGSGRVRSGGGGGGFDRGSGGGGGGNRRDRW